MGAPLDGRDDRHAYIRYVFQNLNAFVMDLAPYAGIGDVFERLPIDANHEVPARAGEDDDLVRPILRNPVEGIDNLGMGLCGESERPTVAMKLGDQHAVRISR